MAFSIRVLRLVSTSLTEANVWPPGAATGVSFFIGSVSYRVRDSDQYSIIRNLAPPFVILAPYAPVRCPSAGDRRLAGAVLRSRDRREDDRPVRDRLRPGAAARAAGPGVRFSEQLRLRRPDLPRHRARP